MKILIYSHAFHPSVGGSESACRVMAEGLAASGHDVRVVTQTPGPEESPFVFPITRLPSPKSLLHLVHWCDVYVHSNVSLRGAWPLLWHHRPWVVIHHSRITRVNDELNWIDHLKRYLLRYATNISVSRSMADSLPVPSTVIGNGYDDSIFHHRPEVPRNRDVMFLGRLNRDKGAHVVLEALRLLKEKDRNVTLTIVGTGREEEQIRQQVIDSGLTSQVLFAGKKEGSEIGVLLSQHRILVVPSLVAETFGLVVMEGLASGCGVLVSDVGALKDTLGPCGLTFPKGDAVVLASRIETMLQHPELVGGHQAMAADHLRPYQRANSLQSYLSIIERAVARPGKSTVTGNVLFTRDAL